VTKRVLTRRGVMMTIPLVGQTDAGSAEVQPARDNQPKATNGRWGGRQNRPSPNFAQIHSELCDAFKKPSCQRQDISLKCKVDLSISR
jgi:hypothetical protein